MTGTACVRRGSHPRPQHRRAVETHHDEAGLTVAHDLRRFLCRIPEDDERFRVKGGWNGRDEFVETLLGIRPATRIQPAEIESGEQTTLHGLNHVNQNEQQGQCFSQTARDRVDAPTMARDRPARQSGAEAPSPLRCAPVQGLRAA